MFQCLVCTNQTNHFSEQFFCFSLDRLDKQVLLLLACLLASSPFMSYGVFFSCFLHVVKPMDDGIFRDSNDIFSRSWDSNAVGIFMSLP